MSPTTLAAPRTDAGGQLQLDAEPEGIVEKVGDAVGVLERLRHLVDQLGLRRGVPAGDRGAHDGLSYRTGAGA